MKADAADLLEFAETEKKPTGRPCPICALPERAVIDEAKRAAPEGQVGGEMVRRWLVARHGYTDETVPSRGAFDRHFHRRHHEEAA